MPSPELVKKYPRVFLTRNLVRLCRGCIKQFHIPQDKLDKLGWDITHGVCNRHFVEVLERAGITEEEIKALLKQSDAGHKRLGATPSIDFKTEYQDLLPWFKNPTPPTK